MAEQCGPVVQTGNADGDPACDSYLKLSHIRLLVAGNGAATNVTARGDPVNRSLTRGNEEFLPGHFAGFEAMALLISRIRV